MTNTTVFTTKGKGAAYTLRSEMDGKGGALILSIETKHGTRQTYADTSLQYLQSKVEPGVTLSLPGSQAFGLALGAPLPPPPPYPAGANEAQKLAFAASYYVGKFHTDSGPGNGNLACAWAVNFIVKSTGQAAIDPDEVSTHLMYEALRAGRGTLLPGAQPGCIIISPTLDVPKNGIKHGHVGIVGDGLLIYANNSNRAVWSQGDTMQGWIDYYTTRGGMVTEFYAL